MIPLKLIALPSSLNKKEIPRLASEGAIFACPQGKRFV
jgi:hypothetical protein